MNKLLNQHYFQLILNQFIIYDIDIISWKLTCKTCFLYMHNVYIYNYNYKYNCIICNVLNPIYINLTNYKTIIFTEYNSNCCTSYFFNPTFDRQLMTNYIWLKNIKYLILGFTFGKLRDENISMLTSLQYLDLGMYNYFTDNALLNLKNLETLYLGINRRITKNIFDHLPNLKKIQIPNDSKILIKDIPEYIQSIIVNYYDLICIKCGGYESIISRNIIK